MKTILIIDDNKENRLQIKSIIAKINEKYNIIEAIDSSTALHALQNEVIDLVFVDIMLPDKSGPMLCSVLKDQRRFIPIIAISAHDENAKLRERILQAGADDIIRKPFIEEVIQMRVKSYLRFKENNDRLIEKEKQTLALTLAVTASHEINQPLMILKGNIDLLKLKIDKNEYSNSIAKYLEKIDTSVNRITEILAKFNNLRDSNLIFDEYIEDSGEMVLNLKKTKTPDNK
eukprot:Anaeramoba_ignava/a105340_285.p1 GENE.a105340_285~~a105340_285.p1  ORF type:complete len:231 (-),score=33.52 a105340_285:341-1033(-)